MLDVLGGEGVQPAQPVRAGHTYDAPVREVDRSGHALFAQRVAVMCSDAGVRAARLDGARPAEQWAAMGAHASDNAEQLRATPVSWGAFPRHVQSRQAPKSVR